MLSKIRMKFRDLFPFCRFPTVRRPVNKLFGVRVSFVFHFLVKFIWKVNVKKNFIIVCLLRRQDLCLMLYVFGVYQQGTCPAGIRQDDIALGSSISLGTEIRKRPFSAKWNIHFLKGVIPFVFYMINIRSVQLYSHTQLSIY